jgi:phage terminase large subunit
MAAAAITNPTWAYDALPTQRRFHTDLRTRYKGYSGPIGSGKSKALCYEGIFLAQLNPGRTGLIGAPTYPMLRDATQAAMFEILADEGLGYSFNKSENRLTMARTGSQILFRSLDDFERLRGTNLAWFGIDELTYCKQESWSRLEGRLRDRAANRPCGFAVWTPKGFDWVYRKFIAGTNPEYRGYRGSPRENRHLPADFYDRLATSYDERFFKQEVLGEYLNVNSGAAYYAFDRTADVRKCRTAATSRSVGLSTSTSTRCAA